MPGRFGLLFVFMLLFPVVVFGESDWEASRFDLQYKLDALLATQPPPDVCYIDKRPGHYTRDDWEAVIDATWGAGLPTAQKLQIFDTAWEALDTDYAAFQHLAVDLDSLRNLYRPEIEAGVSRGRFAAIMNYLSYAMQDAHTLIFDAGVNRVTALQPGVPLVVLSTWQNNDHFGACLTPLPDQTLLVYQALPNHVLGLQAGDLVLGYDGVPWAELVQELIAAQLPIYFNRVWGSTTSSIEHGLLMSAGMNWHLFDTIDVVKFDTGDTLHLPTLPLVDQYGTIWDREQLPVPGVAMPDIPSRDFISWGIVDGTNIGYVYISSWSYLPEDEIEAQYYEAIYNLMFNYYTEGLIIDQRLNYGGSYGTAQAGHALLFDDVIYTYGYDIRCGDPADHFSMCSHPSAWYQPPSLAIPGDPDSFYDKPIAILTGPGAVSNGDVETFRYSFHPQARLFGKPPSSAFTLATYPDLGHPEWFMVYGSGNGYRYSTHEYMTHVDLEIDEEVWLTRDDVANGVDTVVEAAMAWINSVTGVEPGHAGDSSEWFGQSYPNPFRSETRFRFSVPVAQRVRVAVYNTVGQRVRTLLDRHVGAGSHMVTWDGRDDDGVVVSSGVYVYRLRAGHQQQPGSMVFMR